MPDNLKVFFPFYVPFMTYECEFFNEIKDDLIKVIMKEHNKAPFTLQGDFPTGARLKQNITESAGSFLVSPGNPKEECIKRLVQWIIPLLSKAYLFLEIKHTKIAITDSWFHVAKKGGFHGLHSHSNTPLAGLFYVQDGNSNIGNTWVNPFLSPIDNKHVQKWCPQCHTNEFVSGQLVLFPGWILHQAVPHNGDSDRIVIAFNSNVQEQADFELSLEEVNKVFAERKKNK